MRRRIVLGITTIINVLITFCTCHHQYYFLSNFILLYLQRRKLSSFNLKVLFHCYADHIYIFISISLLVIRFPFNVHSQHSTDKRHSISAISQMKLVSQSVCIYFSFALINCIISMLLEMTLDSGYFFSPGVFNFSYLKQQI